MAVFHRWTKEMEVFLTEHYQWVGDFLLAEEMNDRFPHPYKWNKKHIEKKRQYLKLKRNKEQEGFVRWFATTFLIDPGNQKMWTSRGRSKPGDIRVWKGIEHIKTDKGFIRLSVHTWTLHHGAPPVGFNVCIKDLKKTAGDISNLELVSDGDLGVRNKLACYPTEIRQSIITLRKLNKTIYEKQDAGFKQSSVRAA